MRQMPQDLISMVERVWSDDESNGTVASLKIKMVRLAGFP